MNYVINEERLTKLLELRVEVNDLAGSVIEYMPKTIRDTVLGSTSDDPRKRILHIEGINKEYDDLENELAAKVQDLIQEIFILEDWLDSVRTPKLRTAFRMRYGKGKTWDEIGKAVGCDRTTIRDKCKAFLAGGYICKS